MRVWREPHARRPPDPGSRSPGRNRTATSGALPVGRLLAPPRPACGRRNAERSTPLSGAPKKPVASGGVRDSSALVTLKAVRVLLGSGRRATTTVQEHRNIASSRVLLTHGAVPTEE